MRTGLVTARRSLSFQLAGLLAGLAAFFLAPGCSSGSSNGTESVTLTVTADPTSVLADGKNTVSITVTATQADGSPATGVVIVTTDHGTFDGKNNVSGDLSGGSFGPLTLTTCDSFADPSCAGTTRVRATLGTVSSNALVTFEPWERETNCEDGADDDGDGLVDCADTEDCVEGQQLSDGRICSQGAIACAPGGDTSAAETNETTCDDGVDNDCDGAADCDDPDCDAQTCGSSQTCVSGACTCTPKDKDGNTAPVEANEESCFVTEGADNDCDGLVDGDDPDCLGKACSSQGESWQLQDPNDPASPVVCQCLKTETTETSCDDGLDNDCNGVADCADASCDGQACTSSSLSGLVGLTCSASAGTCLCATDPLGSQTETDCANGIDDDCDGLVDCDDTDCDGSACDFFGRHCVSAPAPACACPGGGTETACGNGVDDDCDGQTDCADSDCNGSACGQNGLACSNGTCACPGGETTESSCGDGLDNDCDGARDCADSDCDTLSCSSCGSPNCLCDLASTSCVIDPGTNHLTLSADKARVIEAFYSDAVEVTLTATVTDNVGAVSSYQVDFSVPQGTIVESGGRTYSATTDANGQAVVHWRPETPIGKDVAASATIVTDPQAGTTVTKSVLVDVVGLQVIKVQSLQYQTMGAKDSGWQDTSLIRFQVLGTNGVDTNLPVPDGVPVTFTLDSTAGDLNLTVPSATTLNSVVETTVNAGTQAITFTVTAEASAAGTTVSVTTPTITIVGAKPSYAGFVFSCNKKNVNGLGTFPVDSGLTNTTINVAVTCTVNVNDRWNNPIATARKKNIQFLTEGGTIDSSAQVQAGRATVTFRTAGLLGYDTTPLPNEPSWVWTDSSSGTTRTRNPRDGFYALVAHTSGEEQFMDANGNGIYDVGEQWVDLGEPFVDRDDSGDWTQGEVFIDANANGVYDGPNGVWDANTTIWTETRIVVSGCTGDGNPPGLGFQIPNGQTTAFGDIPDGGQSTTILRASDINLNLPAGGSSVTVAKTTGSPINKVEFAATGTSSVTVADGWGMNWVRGQDCATGVPNQCVPTSSIAFASSSSYGFEAAVSAIDGQANNQTGCTTNADCNQAGAACVNGSCQLYESFSVRATVGPCGATFFGDGNVD